MLPHHHPSRSPKSSPAAQDVLKAPLISITRTAESCPFVSQTQPHSINIPTSFEDIVLTILPIPGSTPLLLRKNKPLLIPIPGFSRDFTASVGPYTAPDQSRKNCQINVGLQFSSGFQYSVVSADYSGWGDLDAGVKGTVKANYYFSGEQDQVSLFFPALFNM